MAVSVNENRDLAPLIIAKVRRQRIRRVFTSVIAVLLISGVSIGIYAGVLHALGLLDGLSQVADISNDRVGQALSSAALPKRVHLKRPAGTSRDS
jgi:hypothetical protein